MGSGIRFVERSAIVKKIESLQKAQYVYQMLGSQGLHSGFR
jgi:hypothetical protein